MVPRTPTPTLIAALRILATEIQSPDGVANAAIAEAADRLEELEKGLRDIIRHHETVGSLSAYSGTVAIAKTALGE